MRFFSISELPYHDDLRFQYQSLSDLPGFILLESLEKSQGRYDILSALPYEKRILKAQTGQAQHFIEQLKKDRPRWQLPIDLPFQGGMLGFFSYDLGLELAGIESLGSSVFKDDFSLAEVGFYDWAIVTDHLKKTVTLLIVNSETKPNLLKEEILSRWHTAPLKKEPDDIVLSFEPLISKQAYQQGFETIQQFLREGRCYQVNYTQPFRASYCGESWDIYQQARAGNPVPFAAFMRTTEGDILSFSPERFLQYHQGHVLASPIKGTEKRSSHPDKDKALILKLQNSEKNQAENVMIVDMLRNDLSKIAEVGSIHVSRLCGIESFASVHHLVSDIEANSRGDVDPLDIFLACFPGASITGAPKLESLHVINEIESYRRGVYCGSLGYFSAHGRFDTNIAIRTLMVKENSLCLFGGGGIVIDSDCQAEYEECLIKIESIARQFALHRTKIKMSKFYI